MDSHLPAGLSLAAAYVARVDAVASALARPETRAGASPEASSPAPQAAARDLALVMLLAEAAGADAIWYDRPAIVASLQKADLPETGPLWTAERPRPGQTYWLLTSDADLPGAAVEETRPQAVGLLMQDRSISLATLHACETRFGSMALSVLASLSPALSGSRLCLMHAGQPAVLAAIARRVDETFNATGLEPLDLLDQLLSTSQALRLARTNLGSLEAEARRLRAHTEG